MPLKEVKKLRIGKSGALHRIIEGDNLEVLQELHKAKTSVDLIYIDPPYNTGNKSFTYRDDFSHEEWKEFMRPRLELGFALLSDDGFIFISIDDNEFAHLRILCDELFGERNFIGAPVRRRRNSQANLSRNLSIIHEYVLIYRKSDSGELNRLPPTIKEADYKNPDNDPRGPYTTMPCTNKGGSMYTIRTPTGNVHEDEWRFKRETYDELVADDRIVFPRKGDGKPRYKLFLKDKLAKGVIANSWWDDVATNQEASKELKEVFEGELPFNNPKPVGLLKRVFDLGLPDRTCTVLDFFAGSGSTGHALIAFNRANGTSHECMLITNNENGIARDICYERIKRVIETEKVSDSRLSYSAFARDELEA